MDDVNYCKNLWEKNAKVQETQKDCDFIMNLAIQEGAGHFDALLQSLDVFDAALSAMAEEWDRSFVTLSDKVRIFGPEYEALKRLGELEDYDIDIMFRSHTSILEDGFVKRLLMLQEPIYDLSALKYFCKIVELAILPSNQIELDLDLISQMTTIERLNIRSSQVSDLSPLVKLPKLEFLDISLCRNLKDISPALDMPQLRKLRIDPPNSLGSITKSIEVLKLRGVEIHFQ